METPDYQMRVITREEWEQDSSGLTLVGWLPNGTVVVVPTVIDTVNTKEAEPQNEPVPTVEF